jgi:transcriptional regulator with XRE-family HTH domain
LGKLFGVTPQAVYKWLTGSALPSSSRAPHVAEVLGVRKAWLFDGEEPMRARLVIRDQGPPYEVERDSINMSSLEYRLLAYFRGLSSQQRKVVMDLLASMQRKSQEEVRENLDGES